MRLMRSITIIALAFAALVLDATMGNMAEQVRAESRISQRSGAPQRGGRGRGRRQPTQTLNVSFSAWPDGGQIPLRYSQVGGEISPGVSWSNVPPGTQSFVLIMRDLDTTNRDGKGELMHWLLWNIPGSSTGVPQDLPELFQLEDGTGQISASGPRYRGPGAMADGPIHHYVIEVFALDTSLDVEVAPRIPRGDSPADLARDAVFEGMQGHVLGKGAYFGLFRRSQ